MYNYIGSYCNEAVVIFNYLLENMKICGICFPKVEIENGRRTNMTNTIVRYIWKRCRWIGKYTIQSAHCFQGQVQCIWYSRMNKCIQNVKYKNFTKYREELNWMVRFNNLIGLTWFLRYHFAFFPLWDSLQVNEISSQVPCLMLRSCGSSIHSNFS